MAFAASTFVPRVYFNDYDHLRLSVSFSSCVNVVYFNYYDRLRLSVSFSPCVNLVIVFHCMED